MRRSCTSAHAGGMGVSDCACEGACAGRASQDERARHSPPGRNTCRAKGIRVSINGVWFGALLDTSDSK